MVYIYVCKRFKVTMDMVSGKDGDWVNNLLQFYCKHGKITGKLERAEINPKKRTNVSFDSSTDVFKINLVYKDSLGVEHELKWLIKVTRSDINETADVLLHHEKQVYARLMGDFINIVKQRAAGRLEESRLSFRDLLHAPEFIYEEITHQADLVRNVLVLDNLEEKNFSPLEPGGALNLCHMRMIVKTVAKFHAVSLTYKQMLFSSFASQKAQVKASRQIDEVVMEGENRVLTGRHGLFARFPFLANRQSTLSHLIVNRVRFLDMYQRLLECFPEEEHLVDVFEYIRISTDDIMLMNEDIAGEDYQDSPLDSITLGVLEARSFLFCYEDDENEDHRRRKKSSKLQRSQSERTKDRSTFDATRLARQQSHHPKSNNHRLQQQATKSNKPGEQGGKMQNKFLQNVIGKSKDDGNVPLLSTARRSSRAHLDRDPNQPPKRAALVNAKYVTYGRMTRDLAVLFFTSASSLTRRYYLIKMLECYAETLGITLGQLGIDTDALGVSYLDLVADFQQHVLYGFLTSVLIAMATTSQEELDLLSRASRNGEEMPEPAAANLDSDSKYLPLTKERVAYLRDLMRDIGAYVESADFEKGLPITNFHRYHELWSMADEEESSSAVEDDDEEEVSSSES